MHLYELLRTQWVLAAVGGGLVLVMTTVAAYLSLWLPRPGPASEQAEGRAPEGENKPSRTVFLAMPVVLVLTYIVILIFTVAYFADKIASPPNW